MPDLDLQLQLVHLSYARNFDIDIWLKVAAVFFVGDEIVHFFLEELNVFKRGVKADIHEKLFPHRF